MEKDAELAQSIEIFIEKDGTVSDMVKWPDFPFKIVGISKVEIIKNTLKDFGSCWTFEGSALLSKDDKSKVITTQTITFIGNATIESYFNKTDYGELIPKVKQVIITMIK